MGNWIPDAKPWWWDALTGFAKDLATYGPVDYFRRIIVRFILGGLFGFVLSIAGIISGAWTTVATTFGGAGATLWNTIGGAIGGLLITPVTLFNDWVFHLVLGNSLGGLEAPFVAVLYLVEFAVVIRLAKPLLLAVADLAGAIPVIGSVITGGVTFLVAVEESLFGTAKRILGGIA